MILVENQFHEDVRNLFFGTQTSLPILSNQTNLQKCASFVEILIRKKIDFRVVALHMNFCRQCP